MSRERSLRNRENMSELTFLFLSTISLNKRKTTAKTKYYFFHLLRY